MEARQGSDLELQARSQQQRPRPQKDRAHLFSMEQSTQGEPEDQNKPLLSPGGTIPSNLQSGVDRAVWERQQPMQASKAAFPARKPGMQHSIVAEPPAACRQWQVESPAVHLISPALARPGLGIPEARRD